MMVRVNVGVVVVVFDLVVWSFGVLIVDQFIVVVQGVMSVVLVVMNDLSDLI